MMHGTTNIYGILWFRFSVKIFSRSALVAEALLFFHRDPNPLSTAVAVSMAVVLAIWKSRVMLTDLNAVPCYFSLMILFITRFKKKN